MSNTNDGRQNPVLSQQETVVDLLQIIMNNAKLNLQTLDKDIQDYLQNISKPE